MEFEILKNVTKGIIFSENILPELPIQTRPIELYSFRSFEETFSEIKVSYLLRNVL
jgi:hypothetical protein